MSAIDAIRQTDDVKIRGKDVKVSGLTKKLFGFEGMMAAKNFKRNRKRYRATVVSLFLSVTLFIAASSFCTYLTDLVGSATANDASTDIIYYTAGEDRGDPDALLAKLTAVPGVTGGGYADGDYVQVRLPLDAVSGELWNATGETPETWASEGSMSYGLNLAFVDDDTFRALCAESGIDAGKYFGAEEPLGVIYNRNVSRTFDESGNSKWYDVKVLDESKLPVTLTMALTRDFDGYVLMEQDESTYYYYPIEYVEEFNRLQMEDEDAELDRSEAMVKTEDEAVERISLPVGGVVKSTIPTLMDSVTAVIYPYSAKEAVLSGSSFEFYATSFALTAPDHARACETIRQQLSADGMDTRRLYDQAADKESQRMLVTVVRVFSYGFIILISLIAMANVFNTISTGVMLRRREFAMLKSIGLGEKGFRKMMNYECIIYGCKGLLWGLPAAVGLTYVIYRVTVEAMERSFYLPWHSVVIAVGSVFAVVFATMLYATGVIRKDNPIDALKQENL